MTDLDLDASLLKWLARLAGFANVGTKLVALEELEWNLWADGFVREWNEGGTVSTSLWQSADVCKCALSPSKNCESPALLLYL